MYPQAQPYSQSRQPGLLYILALHYTVGALFRVKEGHHCWLTYTVSHQGDMARHGPMCQRTNLRFSSSMHCKSMPFRMNKDVIYKAMRRLKTRTVNRFSQFPRCNTSRGHIELLRRTECLKLFSFSIHGQPGGFLCVYKKEKAVCVKESLYNVNRVHLLWNTDVGFFFLHFFTKAVQYISWTSHA